MENEISTQRVGIPMPDGGDMAAYVARPSSVPTGSPLRPVLVCQEIFGVNAHIRSVAERLARAGWLALAPDLFHRHAPGLELDYSPESVARGREVAWGRCTTSELVTDLATALAWLRAVPGVDGARAGVVGFCWGGHVSFLAATTGSFAAAACFYGTGVATRAPAGGSEPTLARAGGIRGEVLCLYGEEDASIPAAEREAVDAALAGAGVPHRTVVYPGAGHGFFCELRASYAPEAAARAWDECTGFFERVLRRSAPGR